MLFFPEDTKTFASDDQPFYSIKLVKLKRRKARVYGKHRKFRKCEIINIKYETELSKEKEKLIQQENQKSWKSESSKLV